MEFSVGEVLWWEASTAEFSWDVLDFEVKVLVRILDEFESLLVFESDKLHDHVWHKRASSCSVE